MNNVKCPSILIYSVLVNNTERTLSVKEIASLILENYSYQYDVKTIVKYIDVLKSTGHEIIETSERRGIKRIPTKTFKIIIHEIE